MRQIGVGLKVYLLLAHSDVVPVTSSAGADPTTGKACYERKHAGFRKENGKKAPVIDDQINGIGGTLYVNASDLFCPKATPWLTHNYLASRFLGRPYEIKIQR